MAPRDIQLDLFPTSPALSHEAETLELMRPHKWAHGGEVELALVSIELVPHDGKWMWASCLNSHNGSSQGSKALPKWNRFADTKTEALMEGVDQVRAFIHRATELEQQRITAWLSQQVSRAFASTPQQVSEASNNIELGRATAPTCVMSFGIGSNAHENRPEKA